MPTPFVLALVALALLTAEARAEPDHGPAAAVLAYHAALAAGDARAAAALLAFDAVVIEDGSVESRAEYVAGHLAADIEFARAVAQTRSEVRVVRAGEVAWVSASSRSEGTFRGREIHSAGAELMVLSHEADGWRIRAIHWSARPLADALPPSAR